MSGVLLDTHAAIWLVAGIEISPDVVEAIVAAGLAEAIHVSPISAWEIGMLAKNGAVSFKPDPERWFAELLRQPNVRLAPLSPEIAISASFLPEPFHRDPADRMLVATARALRIPLVTRDSKILTYGDMGHVQTIAC